MKKILLSLMAVVLVLSGCNEKDNEPKVVEDNTIIEEQNKAEETKVEETNTKKYSENTNYFYLVDNELFFTNKNGEFKDKQNSNLTLNDVANNNAFYSYNNIFDNDEKEQHVDLNIATYYVDSADVPHEDPYYDLITSSLDSDDIISAVSGEEDNWFDSRDVVTYKMPVDVIKNGDENIIDCLGVYGANIRFEHGFTTNDPDLAFIYPEITNNLSEKAKEYLDKYISDNKLKVDNYDVKHFAIDLNNDGNIENVYVIENRITKTENGYIDGYEQFVNDNKIALVFIEDDNVISVINDSFLTTSSSQEELWDNLEGDYKENYNVAFADFNRDGNLEMLIESEAFQVEPFYVIQMVEYKNKTVVVDAVLNGPNH